MSMSWNGFTVAVVMNDGKIIEQAFGFDNEESVTFSDQSGLFKKIDSLKDFQNQLLAAFSTGDDGYGLKEMLRDLGDPDTISVVTRAMKGYDPQDIAVVVLVNNRQNDPGREYKWKKYKVHPYRLTQGKALAKDGEDLYSDAVPTVHDLIHDTILTKSDIPSAKTDKTDKGAETVAEDAQNGGESWERDGFKVENGVLIECGEAQEVMHFPAVRTINLRFLRGKENLEELVFSEGTEAIEHGFYGCRNLRRVVFPKSLRKIGEVAFCRCEALTELTFPEKLKEIGSGAFTDCSNLRRIDIPDGTVCGSSAFYGCHALADKDGFVIVNGTLFDFVKDSYDDSRRDADGQMIISIPPEVKAINGGGAFETIDCFGECIGTFTVADTITHINPEDFNVWGIHLFRIVDHVTGQTIFETDAFETVTSTVNASERFEEFCELVCEKDYDVLREDFAPSDDYQASVSTPAPARVLPSVVPDRALYPHYAAKSSSLLSGFGGVTIIQNASGMDYQFIKLEANEDDSNSQRLVERVYKLVSRDYPLADTARGMIRLFHVDEAVFSAGHDRECELREGYMHKAYMMSALRSFAWTLAAYCKAENRTPETVELAMLLRIAEHIEEKQWLNYDGSSYCKGLCAGSDLHTFYLPDALSQAERERFLPTREELEQDREIKEKFPNYSPTYSEVHSLDALREDLGYIYPAVRTLCEDLASERDASRELDGAAADVVYAWIALAIAAENPFFTEDGPMRCFFSWPKEDKSKARPVGKKASAPEKKTPKNEARPAEKDGANTIETDSSAEVLEQKRAAATLAAETLRETLAQETQQFREQMKALYEQRQREIEAAEAEKAERARREAEFRAEQKRREEAAAAERKRREEEFRAEQKRREEAAAAERKRREAAARELELTQKKTQLEAQRDDLRKQQDAIKGLFAKARKAKLEPQIAELEAQLMQTAEELNALRAMKL